MIGLGMDNKKTCLKLLLFIFSIVENQDSNSCDSTYSRLQKLQNNGRVQTRSKENHRVFVRGNLKH